MGKVVGFWAWLAQKWALQTAVSIVVQLLRDLQWVVDMLIIAVMVAESMWVSQ